MAITNTRTVERIEVRPGNDDPSLMVVYTHTFDDSTDDQLPISTEKTVWLERYTLTGTDADGNPVQTATVVTGEDQLVQDICAAIWAD